MVRMVFSLFATAMLCVSCNQPAVDRSQSLVGAGELPSTNNLSRETLYIWRGDVSEDGVGDSVSYELRPNNSLTVIHVHRGPRHPAENVKGKETLRISPEVAMQFRKSMWRVRPATLEGQGLAKPEVRPVGCERQADHDFGEVSVTFVGEANPMPSGLARLGMFRLPSAHSCDTPAATEARAVVWNALRLLPETKVVAGFDRTQ